MNNATGHLATEDLALNMRIAQGRAMQAANDKVAADLQMEDKIHRIIEERVPAAFLEMSDALPPGDERRYTIGLAGRHAVWEEKPIVSFDVAYEWAVTISASTASAAGGQVKYSGALIGTDAAYTCSLSGITDGQTWFLFVEVNLGAGTLELKVQATRPVDDPANSLIRHALCKVSRAGTVYTRTLVLHKGAIQISGVFNQ
jgi:hypothetical protein